ncbi:MAG: energy transducer TonB [Rhodanobacter sp.]
MDTRYIRFARHRARGAARPVVLAVIAVVILLAAASWFLIFKPHEDLVEADAGGHPSTPVAATSHEAAPPVNVEAMSVNQLLAEARNAMNEQRVLAPTGNNAFEFYLKVLEKQPGNQVAADALRETFPFAASAAEQAINQRDFDGAQREIDLLAKADPANYTLTILRSKLDAQRKLLDKEQQQQLDQQHQQQLAAQKAVTDKAEADKLAVQQQSERAIAQQKAAEQARAAQQQQQAVATTSQQPSGGTGNSASGGSDTRDPVLVKMYKPRYPTMALRNSTEGWVEVAFTVDADGNVSDAKVLDAQPRHVFDSAAIDAVRRWKFQPALQNGTATASQQRKHIDFKLNATQ